MPTPEEQVLLDQQAAKAAADAAAAKAAEEEEEKDPVKQYEAFLETLDPAVRKELEGHTASLKNALVSERGISKTGKDALKKLQVFEKAEDDRKKAALSEVEKAALAKKQAEDEAKNLKTQLQDERIKNAVLTEAAKQAFADPLDAYTLVDRESLEIDDDGKVDGKSVEAAVKALAKAKPYLLGEAEETRSVDIGAGSRGRGNPSANQDEITKRKAKSYHGGL